MKHYDNPIQPTYRSFKYHSLKICRKLLQPVMSSKYHILRAGFEIIGSLPNYSNSLFLYF